MTEVIDQKNLLRKALFEIQRLKKELHEKPLAKTSEIAIIGIGCSLPDKINTVDKLWDAFLSEKNFIQDIPTNRWDSADHFDAEVGKPGKMYINRAAFLDNIDEFDPLFFNISPKEAENIDPQQRILLETVWNALQDACLSLDDLRLKRVGVFVGLSSDDYLHLTMHHDHLDKINSYTGLGTSRSIAAGRLAYFLGTRGPVIQLDTSCSSSLVAIHLAKQSLASNECDLAIVAGVNLILSPLNLIARSQLGSLSPDSQCKAFDDSANGFVPGEGCGAVILRKISDAKNNNDRIYATLVGSAINHDGPSSGLTAPSEQAQTDLINAAIHNANIQIEDVSFIEAHGTGTKLGDPIEISALTNVYKNRRNGSPLYIGSAKSNFGHLEAAAGILSFIKAVLCLNKNILVSSLHVKNLNTHIDWENTPLKVVTEKKELVLNKAGVSSFGMNGSNAHVILAAYHPTKESFIQERNVLIISFSAKSAQALKEILKNYIEYGKLTKYSADDISYSTNCAQSFFDYRVCITFYNIAHLIEQLTRILEDDDFWLVKLNPAPRITDKKLVYIFSGLVSQHPEIGKSLYDYYPTFKAAIDECVLLLKQPLDLDIRSVLWGEVTEFLDSPKYNYIAFSVLAYGLSVLWKSWGLLPAAILSQRGGEYVAACVAGVISLQDCLTLTLAHGHLMQEFSKNHSLLTESILADFRKTAKSINYAIPQVLLISSRTGLAVKNDEINADYWAEQLTAKENFSAGLQWLWSQGYRDYMELGSKSVMADAKEIISKTCERSVWLPALCKQQELYDLLHNLVTLYERGYKINWKGYYAGAYYNKISLPIYPFQRKRYWGSAMDNMKKNNSYKVIANDEVSHFLLTTLANLLVMHVSEIRHDISLLELGADSMLLVSLIKIIDEKYTIKISIRQLFEELTTVSAIIQYITDFLLKKKSIEAEFKADVSTQNIAIEANTYVDDVKNIISNLLNVPAKDLPAGLPLLELGADSMILVSIVKLINEKFSIKLSIRQLFEEINTIDKITKHLRDSILKPNSNNYAIAKTEIIRDKIFSDDTDLKDLMDEVHNLSLKLEKMQKLSISQAANKSMENNNRLIKAEYFHSTDDIVAPPEEKILTNRQHEYLQLFIQKFNKKTKNSKKIAQDSRINLCNNRRSSSGFRFETKEILYPIVADNSKGSKFWDIDGNEYIDIALGYGAHFFGHQPDFIYEAINKQMLKGMHVGPEIEETTHAAKLLAKFTKMERVLFCNSGTEAVMTAMRIARAATSKPKIVIFSNSYHGHFDGTLALPLPYNGNPTEPGVHGVTPALVHDVIVLPFDKESALKVIKEQAFEIAAVLVEPVQNRRPDLHPKEFLQQLRQITKGQNILLIFDEILVGFRIALGGAQEWFGVQADIATYGKVVGGGMPIGVVAGKACYMDRVDGGFWEYEDKSYPKLKSTYTAGTFCKHPLTMAAVLAVMKRFEEVGNSDHEVLNTNIALLASDINMFLENENIPIKIVNFGSFFRFSSEGNLSFTYQPLELDLFFYHLIFYGVYVWEGKTCFISTAHTADDLEKIKQAVYKAVRDMKLAGFWNAVPVKSQMNFKTAYQAPKEYRFEIGSKIYFKQDNAGAYDANVKSVSKTTFSLYYFGDYNAEYDKDKYKLLLDGAHFADENGFEAIWTPERHFHSFGGFSPNPSILSAALARETKHLAIRSSIVLPIHHPVRVAEDWSMIDNLSNGRVGVAFASGWHPNDFIFYPENWGQHREIMFEQINQVQALWRGEKITAKGGLPEQIQISIFPQPMQKHLPMWITTLGNPDTYKRAGSMGANIMTNMIGQDIPTLKESIAIYRQAREEAGFDPETGKVSVLLHTLIGSDHEETLEKAKAPFCKYLNSSVGLFQQIVKGQNLNVDFDKLTVEDREYLLLKAYNRYVTTSALIGSPKNCQKIVKELADIGVTEIACFVDFGVEREYVENSFGNLAELKNLFKDGVTDKKIDYQAMAPIVTPDNLKVNKNRHSINVAQQDDQLANLKNLTEDQQLLILLADMSNEGSLAYNNSTTLRLSGCLQYDKLKQAINAVLNRHVILKSTVSHDRKYLKYNQNICEELDYQDFSTEQDINCKINNLLQKEAQKIFDIEVSLFRATLIKIDEKEHLFNLTIHHIICDGVSVGIILQDIEAYYSSYVQGKDCRLQDVMQFQEFAMWRNSSAQDESILQQEKYWIHKINHAPQPLDLPTDRPRPAIKTYNGGRITSKVDKELYSQLKSFSSQHTCTYFMTLLSIYNILLHKVSAQNKFAVGIAFAGRTLNGSEDLVGYCSTIYPITSEITAELNFEKYLINLKNELLEAYDNQDYPFARLIGKASKLKDKSRSYFFTVAFNWDKVFIPNMHGLEVEHYPQPLSAAEYDLMPNVIEVNDELIISWDYNADLFNEVTIEALSSSFYNILKEIIWKPDRLIEEIQLVSSKDFEEIIVNRNNNFMQINHKQCVHEYFATAAKKYSKNIAVFYSEQSLTYSQLDKLSNQYANTLISATNGVQQQRVGILLKTNLHTLPVILAILKTGNIYVPINPDFPSNRIQQIIEDGNLEIIITSIDCKDRMPSQIPIKTVFIIDEENFRLSNQETLSVVNVLLDDLAYIIYTAGSTGVPKGVQIQHKSIINLIDFMQNQLKLTSHDVICSVSNVATDMAVPDYYLPALVGASVVMIDKDDRLQPENLKLILENRNVTLMQASPSLLKLLITHGWNGKKNLQIISGAEPLPSDLAEKLLQRCKKLWNWYGPTETTVWSTFKRVESNDLKRNIVSIGKPIQNTTIYVLDKNKHPLPDNIPGELFIGGDGISIGYLNREQLNSEKFIDNPYSEFHGDKKIYSTGDKVRFLTNGDLDYQGRIDFQVKIRGNRVELGEIETLLRKHSQISEAACAYFPINHHDLLVAYVKTKDRKSLDKSAIFSYMQLSLPDYMIPNHIEFFDKFTYTDNGKLDRNALPKDIRLGNTRKGEEGVSMNELQERIFSIWSSHLEHKNFGLSDDFFMIGGNSLLLVKIYKDLKDQFAIKFAVLSLFKYSTILEIESLILSEKHAN